MKKYSLFLIIAIVLFSSLSINAQGYFNNTYDFGVIDHPLSIVTDSVENIYVCGWFEDSISQIPHAFVLKTDTNGQELWRVTLADTSKFYAICLTHTGYLTLAGSKKNHCFLTSFDSQTGNEQWINEDTTSNNFWYATVNEILDTTGYELYVRKETNGAHKLRYLLFSPLNGNLLFEYIDINTVYGVAYTSGLMAPDKIWTAGDFGDNNGLVWYKHFGPGIGGAYWTFSSLHIAGVQRYSDNRGCSVHYFDWGGGDYYMQVLTMKLDVSDVWGNSFEIAHDVFSVTGSDKYENGKFVITGTIKNDLALWFIDHDLTYMEDKTIPTQKPRTGIDVVALPSTDMILMGSEEEDNGTDLFLMKLDQNGLVSTGENKLPNHLSIYPNPANDKIFIKNGVNSLQTAKAKILNSLGCTVKTISNLNRPVPVSDLPSGLYVVVVYNSNKLMYREKFIKR